ncbi:hypothetical protein PtA15_1A591 [Puccinia triticina]|uniref:Peptide hydrolase n=1 Tax=Puccinia triticina TaxID=208348 RepID=A0ABY7CAR0_9BASI|nr:uncharacterized protein PtA15_1A591 [Puccinia triticina]WAQ81251.1 hypothetical protein PtA15_1A591 [Puccinia triticina]
MPPKSTPALLLGLALLVLLHPAHSAGYPRPVHDDSLPLIFNLSDPGGVLNFHRAESLLSRILVPRPVESGNLSDCRALFAAHFRTLQAVFAVPPAANLFANARSPPAYSPVPLTEIRSWALDAHRFQTQTPLGLKTFENQVFTHDPSAPRRLVLAAHIDSKFFPTPPHSLFVGATDSAAPVAIILQLAQALTPLLDRKLRHDLASPAAAAERITLQVVLLDGEEAFQEWSDSDSLYGARALASKWAEPLRTPTATMKKLRSLDQIDSFILYDLLGSPQPQIHHFFEDTAWLFDAFVSAEARLVHASLFARFPSLPSVASHLPANSLQRLRARSPFFVKRLPGQPVAFGSIEDDHLPFLKQGVPVLHLIAAPFPQVWHTIHDDRSALDLQTILEWSLISQVVLVQYLGLEPFLDGYRSARRDEL